MARNFGPSLIRALKSSWRLGFTSCSPANGIAMNHKTLLRLYCEERLQVRRRGGRKRALGTPALAGLEMARIHRLFFPALRWRRRDARLRKRSWPFFR